MTPDVKTSLPPLVQHDTLDDPRFINQLQQDNWISKYRFNGENLEEYFWRIAYGAASVEKTDELRYIEHVKRFHKHFPKDQLLIIHTEDFTTDKRWFVGSKTVQEQMEEVYEFLSLEPYHCQIRYQKKNESPDDTLDPDIRQWLIDYYRPYNYELYDYLGRGFFWQD